MAEGPSSSDLALSSARLQSQLASSGGPSSGPSAPTDVNMVKAGTDFLEWLAKKGLSSLGIDATPPEGGVGQSLSLTNGAIVKADGKIGGLAVMNNGKDPFFLGVLKQALSDSSIKSLADGIAALDPVQGLDYGNNGTPVGAPIQTAGTGRSDDGMSFG